MITLSVAVATLALAPALPGCASGSTTTGYTTTTVSREVASYDVRRLELEASSIMGCPTRALSTRAVTDRVWQVNGCGQTREFAWVDLGGGHGAWDPIAPVSTYASNELSCPLDSLVVRAPSPSVRNVSGCGESATYQLTCDARSCAWTMTEHEEIAPRPTVTVIPPPSGARPGPYATRPGATPPPQPYPPGTVIVVPGGGLRPDPRVEQAIRGGIDAQRRGLLACSGSQPMVIHARWGVDGRVWLSLERPFAGTAVEQCVRQTVGGFQVTDAAAGEVVHVVR